MEESPFADVGREDPLFEKLVELAKEHAIVFSDNYLRLDDKMTVGELAMLLTPKKETLARRVANVRKNKKVGAYDGVLSWCKENHIIPASAKAEQFVNALPEEYFEQTTEFTRRGVYAAYKK